MKLQRLETVLGQALGSSARRGGAVTADGPRFLHHARALIEVHDAPLSARRRHGSS